MQVNNIPNDIKTLPGDGKGSNRWRWIQRSRECSLRVEPRHEPPRSKAPAVDKAFYGVPEGAPAICQENARNEDAVKSMAGSTVEYDCTLSL